MQPISSCFIVTLLTSFAFAQFPPQPEGVTTKQVESIPGATISYKQTSICETSAKAWAGYVHLPASALAEIQTDEPYNLSMFFWYFEAREDPQNAPTAIYLAGGPGEPGISGALSDGGPCTVNPDSNSTVNNPYSWNTYVNMLYIDQPVSTGFSYTKLVKSTLDLMFLGKPLGSTGIEPFEAYNGTVPPRNTTFEYGIFSEQNPQKTVNSTMSAAKTLWHFSQAWFSSFPEYTTSKKEVIIFGNSYGGYFVPVTAGYFVEQNAKIADGKLKGTVIPIGTIGWTNGCVDLLVQAEWFPDQAYNNTYGLQVISKAEYEQSKYNYIREGGCRDSIELCRELGNKYDPDQLNINATVNAICLNATSYCTESVSGAYAGVDKPTNRSAFDMAHLDPDPFPTLHWYGYLTQEWVLKDLGVPVNFSAYSLLANNAFFYNAGDPVRVNGRKPMEDLLEQGVKVAMMYGDRDYRCPWNGGEKLSLATEWSGAEDFSNAGYEYVQTNASYQGGVVRQYGNFSFSRIFDAGHAAQTYQPETVFKLFNRAIFSKDLATGKQTNCGTSNNCATSGPSSSFHIKNKLPPPPPFNCNLLSVGGTCAVEPYEALLNGTAEIVDFNVVKPVGVTPGKLAGIQ